MTNPTPLLPAQFFGLDGFVVAPDRRGLASIRQITKLALTPSVVLARAVPAEDVLAVIAYGSAFRPLGDRDYEWRRTGFLWRGPRVRTDRLNFRAKDRDFLVVVRGAPVAGVAGGRRTLRARTEAEGARVCADAYGSWTIEHDVHVVLRHIDDFLAPDTADDTVNTRACVDGTVVAAVPEFRPLLGEDREDRYRYLDRNWVVWSETDGRAYGTVVLAPPLLEHLEHRRSA
jgi:hypothetical protein